MVRPWDFAVPRSSDAYCLFRVRFRRVLPSDHECVGSSKERPQNCGHQGHDQYRQKDEVPGACAGRPGEVDLRDNAAQHEAKALGVIIKNQDMLNVPALGRTCRRQRYRLLNDENSFCPRASLPIRRKKAKRIGRTIFGGWLKKTRVECSGPVMRAPSLHSSRYGKPSHHRHGASVGFFRATCGNIFTPSFEIDRSSRRRRTR